LAQNIRHILANLTKSGQAAFYSSHWALSRTKETLKKSVNLEVFQTFQNNKANLITVTI